jgi:hypothetical protein
MLATYFRNLFFLKLRNITPIENVIWDDHPKLLTCCIVEPRDIKELSGVLNNMARIYGNTKGVGLIIYHGLNNIRQIENTIKTWHNVKLVNLNVENLQISEYSKLLTQKQFYQIITSDFILIFQTDSYIFKKIPEYYFTLDYIGARWSSRHGNNCGNGGFSLRKTQAMIKAIESTTYIAGAEDLYFSCFAWFKCSSDKNLIDCFSVERYPYHNPVACHQPFCSIGNKKEIQNKLMLLCGSIIGFFYFPILFSFPFVFLFYTTFYRYFSLLKIIRNMK